jgi:hypothetical protein
MRLGFSGFRLYPEPLRSIARRLGYDIVRADFNSPIPEIDRLAPSLWNDPPDMPGVDLRLEASLEFIRETLGSFIADYAPPDDPPGTAHGYHRYNPMYPLVDGEILYAMVCHFRPSRIIELGAGFSTLVISDAVARLGRDGIDVVRSVYDPFPSPSTQRASVSVSAVRAEDVPLEVFATLGDGDMLIIDTTHTVKAGGDVNRLLLEVLPAIAPGVIVHIHDFFRPYEYPRRFMAENALYWQEQYLAQAFLACNDAFEVLAANYALGRQFPRELGAIVPGADRYPGEATGSALWLKRVR